MPSGFVILHRYPEGGLLTFDGRLVMSGTSDPLPGADAGKGSCTNRKEGAA
jgi:hypothetical protein